MASTASTASTANAANAANAVNAPETIGETIEDIGSAIMDFMSPSASESAPTGPIKLAVPAATEAVDAGVKKKKIKRLELAVPAVPTSAEVVEKAEKAEEAEATGKVKQRSKIQLVKAGKVKVPKTLEEWGQYRANEKKKEEKERKKQMKKSNQSKQSKTEDESERIPYEDKGEFVFTSDGNVKLSDAQTLKINPYVRAPPADIQGFFVEKLESLKELEEQFAEKKRQLQKIVQAYRNKEVSADLVMSANRDVQEADRILNAAAKLSRRIVILDELIERDIHLEKHYEVRAIADPVREVVFNTFPFNAFWAPAKDVGTAADIGIAAQIFGGAGEANAGEANAGEANAGEANAGLSEEERRRRQRGAIIAAQRAKRGF